MLERGAYPPEFSIRGCVIEAKGDYLIVRPRGGKWAKKPRIEGCLITGRSEVGSAAAELGKGDVSVLGLLRVECATSTASIFGEVARSEAVSMGGRWGWRLLALLGYALSRPGMRLEKFSLWRCHRP